MAGGGPEPADHGEIFSSFVRTIAATARDDTGGLGARVAEHLRTDPAALPVVSQEFASYEQPNLQVALDALRKAAVLAPGPGSPKPTWTGRQASWRRAARSPIGSPAAAPPLPLRPSLRSRALRRDSR